MHLVHIICLHVLQYIYAVICKKVAVNFLL